MANTSFIPLADIDVLPLESNFKSVIASNAVFNDYDFAGSNMAELLRTLSFNSYLNLFYLNMVGSEGFMDSAQLRQSAVSKSKEVNYLPRSRVASSAKVNVTISPTDTPSTITIPKYYRFSTSINGNTYIFTTNESIIVRNNGGYTAANVTIYEGRIVTETFVNDGATRYIIASSNVDTSSITVNVQNSITDTTNAYFIYADTLIGLTSNSNVFFLQGYGEDQYEIQFGNGITGTALQENNVITVTYRDCSSVDGNGAKLFKPINTILGPNNVPYSSIFVSTVSNSVGGAERETIDSIKFNAPRSYPTHHHAITEADYETLIRENFPQIQSVRAIGGQKLPQKLYARCVIATKPFGGFITPDAIKQEIINFISARNILVITPILIDPDYYYVSVNSTINYDTTVTQLTTNDIENLVRASISTFNSNNLNDFGLDFRYSKFTSAIDSSEPSITSNDTTTRMIKRLAPQFNVPTAFVINFNNPIVANNTTLFSYPANYAPRLNTSFYKYKNAAGMTYNAQIQDDGLGNLIVVTYDSGSKSVLASNVGTVDYTTGTVNITNLTASSYTGYINLYINTAIPDINISLNQILVIDQNDVTITVLGD